MNNPYTGSQLLRRALAANGVFSGISGIILIAGAGPLSPFLGLATPAILIGVGLALVLFAAGLFRNALRETINQTEAVLAVVLDVAWVVGSGALILAGPLNRAGNWTVGMVGDFVLLFAVLQFYGLRRMRREGLT